MIVDGRVGPDVRRSDSDDYDAIYAGRWDTDDAVDLLAELAGARPALELGIGTGPAGAPARRAWSRGATASTPRSGWSRSCARSGGTEIPVAIGDFADVGVDGPFALVYVVFSTFFGLLSQEEQVAASTTSPLG